MNIELHIGLDVHKDSIVVALAHTNGSDPEYHGKWGGSNLSVERGLLRLLKKLGLTKEQISIAYEAGPTGFVLARRLRQLGYACIVGLQRRCPRKPARR